MILIDTSAWIEFLRDTRSTTCWSVDAALGGEFATCDPIRMELFAGARDERHLDSLRGLMARAVTLPVEPSCFDGAAFLFRRCRRRGETPRNLVDCLIGAVAIQFGVPVLHRDRDFDVLARHTELVVHR